MRPETRRKLDDLPMRKFMITVSIIGLVVVPFLWVQGHLTWAISILLIASLLVLQAALIDLPGVTYRQLNKLWSRSPKSDTARPDAAPERDPEAK